MIEIRLTKCQLYFTEQEMVSLLSKDPELWKEAIKRGKGIKRKEQSLGRVRKMELSSSWEGTD